MKKLLLLLLLFPSLSFSECESIALDSGHSILSVRAGATSSSGIYESSYNTAITAQVRDRLIGKKYNVVLVPQNDNIVERTMFVNSSNITLLVSIHHDSVHVEDWEHRNKVKGYSLFISEKNIKYDESNKLASLINLEFKKNNLEFNHYHKKNRDLIYDGVYKYNDLIILKYSRVPAILIECGVIVNKFEDIKLKTQEVQDKIVESIVTGIINYCE